MGLTPTTTGVGIYLTGSATTTGLFYGNLSGNANTATNLAANPTDCSANQFANAIAASGNLTCAAITDADIPDNITITETDPVFSAWTGYTHGRLAVVNATTSVIDNLRSATINSTTTNIDTLVINTGSTFPANDITDAEVSNTLTCSDLQAASAVVSDAEVVDTLTLNTSIEGIFTGNIRVNLINATSTRFDSATTTDTMSMGRASTTSLNINSLFKVNSAGVATATSLVLGITNPTVNVPVGGFKFGAGTTTNLAVTGLVSCNTIDSDASGNLFCGTDATGGGSGSNWNDFNGWMTPTNTDEVTGIVVVASSTIVTLHSDKLMATTTIADTLTVISATTTDSMSMGKASTTALNINSLFRVSALGNATATKLVIGTANPTNDYTLFVTGGGAFTNATITDSFSTNKASTTEFNINSLFKINSAGVATATSLVLGTTNPTVNVPIGGFKFGAGTTTNLAVTGLVSCNTIDSDANGNLFCGTDATGGGSGSNWNDYNAWMTPTNTSEVTGIVVVASSTITTLHSDKLMSTSTIVDTLTAISATTTDSFSANKASSTSYSINSLFRVNSLGVVTSTNSWVGTAGTANNIDISGGDLYVQDGLEIDGQLFVTGAARFSTINATTTRFDAATVTDSFSSNKSSSTSYNVNSLFKVNNLGIATSVASWIGTGGTANNINMSNDLYVQDGLEVDGGSWFANATITDSFSTNKSSSTSYNINSLFRVNNLGYATSTRFTVGLTNPTNNYVFWVTGGATLDYATITDSISSNKASSTVVRFSNGAFRIDSSGVATSTNTTTIAGMKCYRPNMESSSTTCVSVGGN
jgi:hypothetical protein